MRPGDGGDREDAESFAGWIRLSYLGLVRVLESEVPSDAVSFGLVKRKVEEYICIYGPKVPVPLCS